MREDEKEREKKRTNESEREGVIDSELRERGFGDR